MKPGRDEVLMLPGTTNVLVKRKTLLSGNTCGARVWTDGKMEAPMLPHYPQFCCHPHTGKTFWIDECQKVDLRDDTSLSSNGGIPFASKASEADMLAELRDNTSLSVDKQVYLMRQLWWMWNDPIRRHGDASNAGPQRPEAFEYTLRRLVEMLLQEENKTTDSRLTMAEALRQLGEHEKASEILGGQFPKQYMRAVEIMRIANEKKETVVKEIA